MTARRKKTLAPFASALAPAGRSLIFHEQSGTPLGTVEQNNQKKTCFVSNRAADEAACIMEGAVQGVLGRHIPDISMLN
ncbi:MAG: hypothetical protein SOT57_02975 [Eubacteriales bacterium]|nr:hypothetical protein [Eubacteriales bacterium]